MMDDHIVAQRSIVRFLPLADAYHSATTCSGMRAAFTKRYGVFYAVTPQNIAEVTALLRSPNPDKVSFTFTYDTYANILPHVYEDFKQAVKVAHQRNKLGVCSRIVHYWLR